MGLRARDRQALSSIETELGASDPRLAGLLDEFSRRSAGVTMPTAERIRGQWLWGLIPQQPARGRAGWVPAVLVLWLVLVGAVIAVALTAGNTGVSGACAGLVPAHCVPRPPIGR